MVEYCVLRKTRVIDDNIALPRPKMTQDVVMKGSKQQCQEKAEELSVLSENQSNDIIEVEITCVRWVGQKTYNSKTIHKDNGKRNIGY